MLAVVADRDVWRFNHELLPRNPHGHERALKEEEDVVKTDNYWGDIYALVSSQAKLMRKQTSFPRKVTITANNNTNKIIK